MDLCGPMHVASVIGKKYILVIVDDYSRFTWGRGLQLSQNIEDSHVTLTPVHPEGLQESSPTSSFVTSMLNPISDAGVESIFTTASSPIVSLQTPTPIMTPSTISTITTSSDAPIPSTIIPNTILENLPTFNSVSRFDKRLRSLETTFSEYRQTNPFVDATDRLQDSLQHENDEYLCNIDENIKKIIKGQIKSQVKEQVSRNLPRIKESMNATLEAEVLTRSSHSSRTSYAIAADLSEMKIKNILIEKIEGNKSIQRSDEQRNLYKAKDPPPDQTGGLKDKEKEESMHQLALHLKQLPGVQAYLPHGLNLDNCLPPRRTPSPDRDWNKTLPAAQGDAQLWISELARQTDARSSFNEFLDTSIDFSNFIMNRLDVATLTLELLAGPTYELMRGSCNSLTELEYHLGEVYKATTDQLDWVNPEGQQYPHNLLQPLPLIPDNRGRRVIPFEHFINNDLEYLRRGASSRKYTTSVTKTKAANYGHIKWIEDLVPRAMWIKEPINYDKHALWGVSHWGRKCQQFYGFTVNWESSLDVYSKRRIIVVTELKIVKWHNYKHLDWIS
nr:ribonuclease H-like domain-containing protein [Tanacetum cinerariifolium]